MLNAFRTLSHTRLTTHPRRTSDDRMRDIRLDFFRGVVIIFMLIDHIPGNLLGRLTLRNFGFSDAAEAFVLIAGISSAMSYAERPGEFGRICRRIGKIYVVQLGLLLASALCILVGFLLSGRVALLKHDALSPFLDNFWHSAGRAIMMDLQPHYLDILPLYICMLAWLPIVLRLAQWSCIGTLALALTIWLFANAYHLNIPGYRDGGWYFNPFAWQLLLSVGVVIGISRLRSAAGTAQKHSRPLLILACLYAFFSFLYVRPWAQFPLGVLKNVVVFNQDLVGPINKSYLSLWRLFHILCVAYIVNVVIPFDVAWIRKAQWARQFVVIGRMPLTSFVVVSLFSTIATISCDHFGN